MRLCIIGATGGIGRELVKQSLDLSHEVTAFARSESTLGSLPNGARTVAGDVADLGAVRGVIDGQDAVLCALGAPLLDRSRIRARGTANIVAAMQRANVNRLICVSALGVGDSRDFLPWSHKYILIPLFMRRLYADHTQQEQLISESSLDWTIVRPGVLGDGPKTETFRAGFSVADRPLHPKISRADVAHFMLKQLESTTYVHQRPCLAY